MRKNVVLGLIFLLFMGITCRAQDPTIDSLKNLFSVAREDSVRFKLAMRLGQKLQGIKPDSALYFHRQGARLAVKQKKRYDFADALNQMGWDNYSLGMNEEALVNFSQAEILVLALLEDPSGDSAKHKEHKRLLSHIYGNTGVIHYVKGNFPKALDYDFRALKINESLKNKGAMALNYGNIATVYREIKEDKKALEYYSLAQKIFHDIPMKQYEAYIIGNMGGVYQNQKDFPRAISTYETALKINRELGDKIGEAAMLLNLGTIYREQGDYSKADSFLTGALDIYRNVGYQYGEATVLGNLGQLASARKESVKAIKMLTESLVLATKLSATNEMLFAHEQLSKAYEQSGNERDAFFHYKKYNALKDSLNSLEVQKSTLQKELQFDYEKKAAADSVKVEEEKKVVEAQLKQEKTQRMALYGGIALISVFSIFIFNRFRVTQKQKAIIEQKEKETQQQKHIIEEKHKEITDSINYAERIQRSFLSTTEMLDENLGEYFILFRPKDVVSGDFYWSAKLENGNFLLATADSTGHGVPGAIMSLLNITSLEKAIETTADPAEILNKTRKTIIERLKKDGSPEGGKDGMDATLLSLNPGRNKVSVAAANNPVWIVRGPEIVEVKPDKMPVGRSDKEDLSFTCSEFDLQKGDVIYTLTDGFPDQFGGEKGKKFKSKNLKELLQAHAHLPMQEQKQLLENTLKSWMGVLEQVDDITVIGVRV